jgi:hypothetical protein
MKNNLYHRYIRKFHNTPRRLVIILTGTAQIGKALAREYQQRGTNNATRYNPKEIRQP